MKKLFWSKWFTWLRKLLGANKPDIPWDKILEATYDPEQELYRSGYRAFSGVDVKFWVKTIKGWDSLPEAQSISCIHREDGSSEGIIELIVFNEDPISKLEANPITIVLEAADEYGHLAHMRLDNVEFRERNWKIDIEDIITNMDVSYTATSFKPWTSEENSPGYKVSREEADKFIKEGKGTELIYRRLDSR